MAKDFDRPGANSDFRVGLTVDLTAATGAWANWQVPAGAPAGTVTARGIKSIFFFVAGPLCSTLICRLTLNRMSGCTLVPELELEGS